MKQVFVKNGQAFVEEVPAPSLDPGTVLVRVEHSCISMGTEGSIVRSTQSAPLWKRALANPASITKGLRLIYKRGLKKTLDQAEGRLQLGTPTGYSAAGTVVSVGAGITDVKPGDRVACAGAQCAQHAQLIRVPRNLLVKIPGELESSWASTVALGSIALQGIRRLQPTLGETFVVIGLGFLGQLTSQMLKANGCQVLVSDLDPERVRLAVETGADGEASSIDEIYRLTDGVGADGVVITAASASDEIVSTAFKMCRRKGRVVLVGDVGLHLKRADFYAKELDFLIATSYGPGRYDHRYEEEGVDYPLSYVRWTENRNMAEYLALLNQGRVQISSLISEVYPLERASDAYRALASKPMMVLLSYPAEISIKRKVELSVEPSQKGKIRIAIVGAGSFARGMHLPNLKELSDKYHLRAIASRTGSNAMATAKEHGADYATTDYRDVIADPEVDAVIIATRHNLHAAMALEALKAGKHVLLEKPLALTREELQDLKSFFETSAKPPVLMTGFNRRFSPAATRIQEVLATRKDPMILNYQMNSGYIPLDHWVHTEEGGGRNLGEACHIYDLFTFLTGSEVASVDARAIRPSTAYYCHRDNFVTVLTFKDGSVATLTYTALGAKEYPKERMEIFCSGKVLFLDDYRKLSISGTNEKGWEAKDIDKGQKTELIEFARVIQQGGEWPIPLWQQLQATEIALEVDTRL